MPAPAAFLPLSPESARWSARLHELAEWITPLIGRWAQDDVLPYISGLQLLLSGLILTATAALITVSYRYAGKAITKADAARKSAPTPAPAASLLRLALAQARKPFLVLISIWGFYCAFSVALFRFVSYADALLSGLGWAKTTALVLDLFWFLFRLINVLEKELTPPPSWRQRCWWRQRHWLILGFMGKLLIE